MMIRVFRDRYCRNDLVGLITYEMGASASFAYDRAYVERARVNGELGISERLPLSEEPYTASEMGPFFSGLLPEGEVYGNLAQLYQVPRNDYLSVLSQLGCESAGALTFVSEGIDPSEYEPYYDVLSEAVIGALKENPVRAVTQETSSTRLSLSAAGARILDDAAPRIAVFERFVQ